MSRQNPMGLYRHSRLTLSNAVLCGGLLFSLAASVLAAEPLQWVVISNGETVGALDVQREGNSVDIAYRVDNNGRGPKTDEKLQLDKRGFPLSWTVSGTSLFGAAVSESYTWDDGVAQWQSQADAGSITIDQPPMYIGGDVSPWSLGMYARAALKAPDQNLDVIPLGRLKLQQLGKLDITNDLTVTVYGLSGIQLDLQLIALDPAGQFFASLGGRGAVIRKGFEDSVPALQEWSRGFELQRMEELQSRLAVHTDLPVRYLNVRVFDSKAQATGALVSVVVSDGIIQSIEPADTRGAEGSELLVDGQGGTLVPGLYDMHAHNSMDSGLFYLAAGVTSTRDMGNDNALLTEIRRATEQGELAGPRIAPAGLIEARSPYSARIGIVADTLEQALEAVRWYAAEGYSEIKTYNSMNPEWVPPIVAEAKALGLRVSGHVPAFMDPDEITLVGYDSIAHINQLMLGWLLEKGEDTRSALRLTAMQRAAELDLENEDVQESVRLMAENGTSLDTTAVILERLMLSRSGEIQPGDLPYLSHMPIGYQRYRKRTFVPLDDPGADVAYREAFQTLLQVVKLLYDNGVGLLIGTDDTTGFTVHRELELYVQAGIPAPAVLSIATLGAATYLGQQDQLGNIEPGKLADFFLVPGDPTEDISLVRQIQLVSRGGVLYFPAQIYTELGIEPFAPPAAILPAETAPAESGPSWFDPTRVSDAPLHSPARTSHKGEFNGVDVTYDALTRELMLHGADGAPAATMFSTAYVRTDIGNTSQRPVLFLFNGGPGASSSPLHLGLGPMRRPEGDDEGALVSNPDSVLDTVDMVFIDPAGTGYTRLITEDAGGQFWGVNQDADAVLYLMHEWLLENDRLESPVFVMGESYGGTRAAVIAER
ncbi:MAG TPA: amidohydrolase family protein, partial [Xanthomonadales bacterium]|nr:amidohydrolase family protein [Xanthomonadales bacterium]